MELIKIADAIEALIKLIGDTRREIEKKGNARAKAISDYDRKIAITLATLRDTENYTMVGQTYKSPPVTILEKIAKGICAEERYGMELAESNYKACVSNLNALQAQLNAYQSLFRHLDMK